MELDLEGFFDMRDGPIESDNLSIVKNEIEELRELVERVQRRAEGADMIARSADDGVKLLKHRVSFQGVNTSAMPTTFIAVFVSIATVVTGLLATGTYMLLSVEKTSKVIGGTLMVLAACIVLSVIIAAIAWPRQRPSHTRSEEKSDMA